MLERSPLPSADPSKQICRNERRGDRGHHHVYDRPRWNRTAHEAMLVGTPVIGSGRAGMRELLEAGGQLICERFEDLRHALVRAEHQRHVRREGERSLHGFFVRRRMRGIIGITVVDAQVMRESFDYTRDTRRDPFVSLMTTSDLRPTLSDLRLTGILYDLSGRRPVAILRDIAGGQWRVTTGMTLGRMRVAQIKPKTIIFTIEEFGFNRQDSLILGDTTRVRHR